jgi:hypothetical protein
MNGDKAPNLEQIATTLEASYSYPVEMGRQAARIVRAFQKLESCTVEEWEACVLAHNLGEASLLESIESLATPPSTDIQK